MCRCQTRLGLTVIRSSELMTTMTTNTVSKVTSQTLKAWLRDGQELALVDVREKGAFGRKHLLLAVNAPLWRLELTIGSLVPRLDTRIVLVDLDGSLLPQAADKLLELGYTSLHLLEGGTLAWEEAGFEVFRGISVPSKAFGEVVEHELKTPTIEVRELHERLQRGEDLVVLDGRTPEEYQRFTIPGARSVPNGELVYRLREVAPNPNTLVVVSCAGRTRSILGAQTLINAGVPNPIVSLKNGTAAWWLAGLELQTGTRDALPEPNHGSLAEVSDRTRTHAIKAGAVPIDFVTLQDLERDHQRSLFLLDVRSREEYLAGHLPGWRWAPGGQLIQATDQYIGVRKARVVLADWDGVRAWTTAAWLAQMGTYDVYVLGVDDSRRSLASGQEPVRIARPAKAAPWISARQLEGLRQKTDVAIFDVESSLAFATKHIAGARFVAPDRLPEFVQNLDRTSPIVITASNAALALNVASELKRRSDRDARALAGGNTAWFSLGLPTAEGRDDILTGTDDDWYNLTTYQNPEERREKTLEYLTWEVALAQQIERDGDTLFRLI